jgi:hypothetical protein
MTIAKESLKTIQEETIKLAQMAELGLAVEKGLEKIKNTIPCKGIFRSEPCKETNTYTLRCSLKYFCELKVKHSLKGGAR